MARGIFRYTGRDALEQAALATPWPGLHDPAPMKLPVRPLLFLLGFAMAELGAQVAGSTPLAAESAASQTVPGGWIVAEHRADQALQNGFPATAAGIYRDLLSDRNLPAGARYRMELSRITALMDAGDLAAAKQALLDYAGPRNSLYQLRAGLIAINDRRVAAARAAQAASHLEELTGPDRGWWYFLQAQIADADGEFPRANGLYEQAIAAAVSELQRARFLLGQEQALLRRGQLSEAQMTTLRANLDR